MFEALRACALCCTAALGAAAPLRLADAVVLAQAHHPEVQRAEALVQQALSRRVGAAKVLQQPAELGVDVGHRHDSSGSRPASTGLEWTVRLGQMVDVAGQRGLRLREVGWARRVAELQLGEARLQAAASSAVDYLRTQGAEASVEVARARAELAQRVLHMVHVKEHAGATGGLERTLAEVEHGDARAQLQRALAAEVAARQALWYGLGLPPEEERTLPPLEPPLGAGGELELLPPAIGATGSSEAPGEALHGAAQPRQVPPPAHAALAPSDVDGSCPGPACLAPLSVAALIDVSSPPDAWAQEAAQLARRSVLQRPQAQALVATEEGLRASVARLGREAVPSPVVAFEAQKQQPGQQYFGAGINVALPVTQRNQGPRAEVAALLVRNGVERRLFAAQCAKDVRVALRQLNTAARVWRTVHGEQLPAAQAHVDMTVAAWRAGKLDLAQVVQSMRYLTEARQRHADAIEALWRARIERSRVLGEMP